MEVVTQTLAQADGAGIDAMVNKITVESETQQTIEWK